MQLTILTVVPTSWPLALKGFVYSNDSERFHSVEIAVNAIALIKIA